MMSCSLASLQIIVLNLKSITDVKLFKVNITLLSQTSLLMFIPTGDEKALNLQLYEINYLKLNYINSITVYTVITTKILTSL